MPLSRRNKEIQGSSSKQSLLETSFFLYTTKLNENATKNLRKASTNKEERQVLAQIFSLLGKESSANPQTAKMEQIMLDFHYINYEFCKENSFSNEKISTFLAIMDYLMQYMLER